MDWNQSVKFVIVGDSGVGKTCAVESWVRDGPVGKEGRTQTIGIEFQVKYMTIAKKKIRVQIWDCAGLTQFRSIVQSYYKRTSVFLLMFDLTNRPSFNHLEGWLRDMKERADPTAHIVVVGTKSDLTELRQVTDYEARQWCRERGLAYYQISTMENTHSVRKLFQHQVHRVLLDVEDGKMNADGCGVCSQSLTTISLEETSQNTKCPSCTLQ